MAKRAIQRNNQSPMGYGQPTKARGERGMDQGGDPNGDMAARLLRPEDQEMFGQGQPPNIYPDQPQWQPPQGFNANRPAGAAPLGDIRNQFMNDPRHQGMNPGQRGQAFDGLLGLGVSGDRSQGQPPQGVPQTWQGGPNRTQPVGAGQQFPSYQGQQQPQMQQDNPYAQLQQATQQSIQGGYTDIAGMRDVFKPGQFQNQLAGFNTNGWGSGERGSDTLKNMMGTIFSNYDVTQPGALRSAMGDIHKALPNATIVEHANEDLLDPDGPNGPLDPVDVIQSAVPGGSGAAWAWQPQNQKGAGMGGPQGPSQQAYMSVMQQGQPQYGGNVGGAPEVGDQNSAMQFLQWLMQQQQQGQMPQYDTNRGF